MDPDNFWPEVDKAEGRCYIDLLITAKENSNGKVHSL